MSNKKFVKPAKNDQSQHINQRDKFKEEFDIKIRYDLTEKQQGLIKTINDKKTQVVFIKGAAGTSKTFISVLCGLQLLQTGDVREIIYSRPILESSDSGSKIGYLPGSQEDKVEPYAQVVAAKLDELLSQSASNKLLEDGRVRFELVNYARGASWNSTYLILDEAQNFTKAEIITLLTRLGHRCKAIILADPMQSDLQNGKRGGFSELFEKFSDQDSIDHGIHTFKFDKEDIVRSGLCKFIIEKLENITIEPMFSNKNV